MKKLSLLLFLLVISKGLAEEKLTSHSLPTVVITCASGELGGAIGKKLASANNLILTGRNLKKLQILQKELQSKFPHNYEIILLDYCDSSSIHEFEKTLKVKKSEISGLVLITPRPQFCSSLLESEANWMSLFRLTFTGPIEVLKKVLSHTASLRKIVVIAGTTSVQLIPEYGPTCVIRRMWTTYVKALSHQLGSKGICINALSPGVVLTDFHVERIAIKARQNYIDYNDQMKQEVAQIPLGRHALPREVAQTVKFLLSNDSDFINGINLVVDGGSTLSY